MRCERCVVEGGSVRGWGNGTRDIHSFIHLHSLETLISRIDRSSRRGSVEWIG